MLHNFTSEQLLEVVKCADPVTGPAYFIEHYFFVQSCDLLWPAHISMHQYVLDYIHNMHSNRMSANMMFRQSGKTLVAAGYALWVALFVPNSRVVFASLTQSLAKDAIARIQYTVPLLPSFLSPIVRRQTKSCIEFDNGSSIASAVVTPNFGRGMTISLLVIDELAYARKEIAQQFFGSVVPTVSCYGGKIIITSSFNSVDNVFQDIWDDANEGKNDFAQFSATWRDQPGRDEEWAEAHRATFGHKMFSTEYENKSDLEVA